MGFKERSMQHFIFKSLLLITGIPSKTPQSHVMKPM